MQFPSIFQQVVCVCVELVRLVFKFLQKIQGPKIAMKKYEEQVDISRFIVKPYCEDSEWSGSCIVKTVKISGRFKRAAKKYNREPHKQTHVYTKSRY